MINVKKYKASSFLNESWFVHHTHSTRINVYLECNNNNNNNNEKEKEKKSETTRKKDENIYLPWGF